MWVWKCVFILSFIMFYYDNQSFNHMGLLTHFDKFLSTTSSTKHNTLSQGKPITEMILQSCQLVFYNNTYDSCYFMKHNISI